MLLCSEDINKLEKKVYSKDSFLRFDKDGYALLRNRQGCCVFYSKKERRCSVYASRPSGCRIYPVILDEDKGIVVEEICHAQTTISDAEKVRRGKRVLNLLKKIDAEAKTRRGSKL
jgi:Fe-S-cluster containining protein